MSDIKALYDRFLTRVQNGHHNNRWVNVVTYISASAARDTALELNRVYGSSMFEVRQSCPARWTVIHRFDDGSSRTSQDS